MPAVASFRFRLEPQLCSTARVAPETDAWLHEIKYDGWRMLSRKRGANVELYTRGGAEWSKRLPCLARAIAELPVKDAWLDGELVYLDAKGRSNFHALAAAVQTGDESRLFLQLWDAPHLDGDVTRTSLLQRKAQLRAALSNGCARLRYTDHVIGNGPHAFAEANRMELEGIVSKRVTSRYHAGERRADWRKVKCWRTRTFVLGGMDWDRDGNLEALLVGSPGRNGLRYEGRVELGLGRMGDWGYALDDLRTERSPFTGEWETKRRTWLRPRHTIEVKVLPQPRGHFLRHATFVRPVAASQRAT